MARMSLFKETVTGKKRVNKQFDMIDQFIETTPFLKRFGVQQATHPGKHVYRELTDIEIDGNIIRDGDGEYAKLTAKKKMLHRDLFRLSFVIQITKDELVDKEQTLDEASAEMLPSYLQVAGQDFENKLIYDQIIAFADETEQAYRDATGEDQEFITDAGGTSANNYSIVLVRMVPGRFYGLYGENQYNQETLFDFRWNNGKNETQIELPSGDKPQGFELLADARWGLLPADARCVHVIANISKADPTSDVTEEMMSKAISKMRARPENSVIVMHPNLKAELNNWKTTTLHTVPGVRDLDNTWDLFNKIPTIDTYNMSDGNEARMTWT